jgi:hypothetical protein
MLNAVFDFGHFCFLITSMLGGDWKCLVWFDSKYFSGNRTQSYAKAGEIGSVLEHELSL